MGTAVVSVTAFLLYPYILHHLGDAAYGAWVLIGSVLGYFGLLDLGISAAVVKMIAEDSSDDAAAANRIVANGVFLFTILGGLAILLGMLLVPFLNRIFHVPGFLSRDMQLAYIVVLAAMGVTFPAAIFSAVLAGRQDFGTHNVIIAIHSLLNAAATVGVLRAGYGIAGMAVASMMVSLLIFAVRAVVIWRRYGIPPFNVRLLDRSLVRRIFSFSKWLFVLNVAVQIIFQMDNVVIGVLSSVTAISFYQVALKPNSFLRSFGTQLTSVVMPAAASLRAANNESRLQRLLLESTRVSAVVLLPALIVMVAWGRDFIRMWVGPDYLSSYPTLLVLAAGVFSTLVQGTAGNIIVTLDMHKRLAAIALVEAAVNLALSVFLIRRLGILGVALGTTVPTMLVAYGISIPYAARLVAVPVWSVYKKILTPAVLAVLFTAAAVLVNQYVAFSNLFELACGAGAVFAAFFAVNVLLDPAERHIYVGILERRLDWKIFRSSVANE
jgi:O-antigen/teichoic acid export membrane protein